MVRGLRHPATAKTFERERLREGRAEEIAKRIVERAGIKRGDVVVDLGCGPGLVSKAVHDAAGGPKVYGVDHSKAMLRLAEKNFGELAGKRFFPVHSKASEFGKRMREEVQHVIATNFFNRISSEEQEKTVKEVHSVLSPGGRFIFNINGYAKDEKTELFFMKLLSHLREIAAARDLEFEREPRWALRVGGEEIIKTEDLLRESFEVGKEQRVTTRSPRQFLENVTAVPNRTEHIVPVKGLNARKRAAIVREAVKRTVEEIGEDFPLQWTQAWFVCRRK
ncbi:class I SAM-dependent methyltransferase [Candidatus Micrarchaeota archaeon]|nr:class I SAM-dependent methyltransferase [Candidatus Micrarchaeota archaeon]